MSNSSPARITIEFGPSSSANYLEAIKVAREAPEYEELRSAGVVKHRASYRLSDLPLDPPLIRLVAGWKSSRILVGEKPVRMADYMGVHHCWTLSQAAANLDVHCLDIGWNQPKVTFGCKRLFNAYRGRNWFHFGAFEPDGRWKVDKERIRQVMLDEVDRSLLELCPAFDKDKALESVTQLPDYIDPSQEPGWEVQYAYPGGVKTPVALNWTGQRYGLTVDVSLGDDGDEDKSGAEPEIVTNSYEDVGGLDDTVSRVRQIVEWPLRHPDILSRFGVQPHRGVIFYGPPGCGKTLLARAVAGETGAAFFMINGPEVLSKWVGESEGNLRRVFEAARKNEPAIVLIDELDAVGSSRDDADQQWQARLVTQLLTLMDGLKGAGRVQVIATTNRVDAVDAALRRPGRFDVSIYVGHPSELGRLQILKVHTKSMPLALDVSLGNIARLTDGFSGAMIQAVCREAAYRTIERVIERGLDDGSERVTAPDFSFAIDLVRQNGSSPT